MIKKKSMRKSDWINNYKIDNYWNVAAGFLGCLSLVADDTGIMIAVIVGTSLWINMCSYYLIQENDKKKKETV